MWIWGLIASFAMRRHIARELRPFAANADIDRELVRSALVKRINSAFDQKFPVE